MAEVGAAWTPSFPSVNDFFLSGVSWGICTNKSITYSEVWDYFMIWEWMFSTPSAQPLAQNNLFHQPQSAPSAPCPPAPSHRLTHPGSSSPSLLLPVHLSQPLSTLKFSSVPAALLASKQVFYFQPKLQVILYTLSQREKHS